MPIVVRPSPELDGKFRGTRKGTDIGASVKPSERPLKLASATLRGTQDVYKGHPQKPDESQLSRMMIDSALTPVRHDETIVAYKNGFSEGLHEAFTQDLHLTLRPDDVWLAILVQFSMYVDGNAERVRHLFVQHQGKRQLTVDLTPFQLSKIDCGRLAQEMTSVIQENVVDAGLKEWMVPTFSTTTDLDKSVASFVMMGAMQEYFEYNFLLGCGFPSVTLLGDKSDWEDILARVERLPKYGPEPEEWSMLLRPTIRHMIRTFDEPDSQSVKNFWLRVAHQAGPSASGTQTLSGWITAFCFWDEEGKRVRGYSDEDLAHDRRTPLSERKRLRLDGVEFPLINSSHVPRGVMALPITLVDGEAGVSRWCTVVAGSVGMRVSSHEIGGGGGCRESAETSAMQPLSGWFVIQEWEEPLSDGGVGKTGSTGAGSATTTTTTGKASSSSYDSDGFDENALP